MAGTSDPVELAAGSLNVALAPVVGGSVAAFRHGAIDVMRPLSERDARPGKVLGVAIEIDIIPFRERGGNDRVQRVLVAIRDFRHFRLEIGP